MIAVDRITTILRVVAVSDMVKDSAPISATLIAPSDAGKSALLAHTLAPTARVINDFTYASLTKLMKGDKPPSRLVVPDFNQVISHKPAVASLTMALLLSVLGEGVTEIPGIDDEARLVVKKFKKRGLHLAMLTGMTPDMFHSRRGKWRSIGLLRRLVPVNYTYSKDTADKIQAAIQRGMDTLDYNFERTKRLKRRCVSINQRFSEEIRNLSQHVIDHQLIWNKRGTDGRAYVERGHDFPFSLHKIFRSYAKAHALLQTRTAVTLADVRALRDFARFVRYDQPEEL